MDSLSVCPNRFDSNSFSEDPMACLVYIGEKSIKVNLEFSREAGIYLSIYGSPFQSRLEATLEPHEPFYIFFSSPSHETASTSLTIKEEETGRFLNEILFSLSETRNAEKSVEKSTAILVQEEKRAEEIILFEKSRNLQTKYLSYSVTEEESKKAIILEIENLESPFRVEAITGLPFLSLTTSAQVGRGETARFIICAYPYKPALYPKRETRAVIRERTTSKILKEFRLVLGD